MYIGPWPEQHLAKALAQVSAQHASTSRRASRRSSGHDSASTSAAASEDGPRRELILHGIVDSQAATPISGRSEGSIASNEALWQPAPCYRVDVLASEAEPNFSKHSRLNLGPMDLQGVHRSWPPHEAKPAAKTSARLPPLPAGQRHSQAEGAAELPQSRRTRARSQPTRSCSAKVLDGPSGPGTAIRAERPSPPRAPAMQTPPRPPSAAKSPPTAGSCQANRSPSMPAKWSPRQALQPIPQAAAQGAAQGSTAQAEVPRISGSPPKLLSQTPPWLAEMRNKVEATRSLFSEQPGAQDEREARSPSLDERVGTAEIEGQNLEHIQRRELDQAAVLLQVQSEVDEAVPDDDIVAWSQGLRMEDLDGAEDEILQALAEVV
mmetsp:Transcript_56589/g.132767  ORF Transcript_56589/g.132767 Transcript_56589/m.132767 type:complete len:378 (-) Transcript_56589:29-1162(-)